MWLADFIKMWYTHLHGDWMVFLEIGVTLWGLADFKLWCKCCSCDWLFLSMWYKRCVVIGYLRPVMGWISVGWVAAGWGLCCLGLVTFVLLFANSNLNVCGRSGSNRTPWKRIKTTHYSYKNWKTPKSNNKTTQCSEQ